MLMFNTDMYMRVLNMFNDIPKKDWPRVLRALNKLNSKMRFVKFCLDDSEEISVEYGFPVMFGDDSTKTIWGCISMYGAILGDIIGAPYEFYPRIKTKEFPLLLNIIADGVFWFTDDSVMTIAVADALLNGAGNDTEGLKLQMVNSMQGWGRKYPKAGYGGNFYNWLYETNPRPYGSYGNGSAMRVSPAGWLYDDLYQTRHIARLTAEVSHNHLEGIKGAESVASTIFLARVGASKTEICDYIAREFGYDLSFTCDEIR